ncbi:MAG TPA: thiamine pyrophosphate-dependent enzyme [Vicinamibacterales bacterium]|jgi:thiamine pyrophosphate-dependent acetolactate synthase large subunit-like protein
MNRLEATRLFVSTLRGGEAVVASLGHPAYDLFAAGDRPEFFYTWGSMGMASSIGLGLALAQPGRPVIVLDGDGSLLMNLGSLATIASSRPPNLTLIVWDNQLYATTGGQPTATALGTDLTAMARGSGIASSAAVSTLEELQAALARTRREAGPHAIVARVEESAPIAKPPLDCVFIKQRFMTAVGAQEGATQGTGA